MWTKSLPTKAGYYWTIYKSEEMGMGICMPLIVGDMGMNGVVELGCALGDGDPKPLEECTDILYWYGPVEAPPVTEEISNEVGELQEAI